MFTSREGFADRPLDLPCGQCIGCRIERSRQWALRCVHEAQMHARNCFITLTYAPGRMPEGDSLDVRDWQKFAKRLRKNYGPFRFFHCGEYGDENLRPHYHACMFGIDFSEDRVFHEDRGKYRLFRSGELDKAWGLGFATVGSLTYESAGYVARYCTKKATGKLADERYARVDYDTGELYYVKPEYSTMSRRPGLGSTWFDKFGSEVFPSDEVVHGGKRFRPPSFYDGKLGEDELVSIKRKRLDRVFDRSEDLTPERLKVREKVAAAQLRRLSRTV